MAKFIKLEGVWASDDPTPMCPLYVNVDRIICFAVMPDTKATGVVLTDPAAGEDPTYVRETPEQILALIAESDKS